MKKLIYPYKIQSKKFLNLHHPQVLKFLVYIFIYEEKPSFKSAKWEVRVFKKILVVFDKIIIYQVYIKKQNWLVKLKNLRIFKNIIVKLDNNFFNFDDKPMMKII